MSEPAPCAARLVSPPSEVRADEADLLLVTTLTPREFLSKLFDLLASLDGYEVCLHLEQSVQGNGRFDVVAHRETPLVRPAHATSIADMLSLLGAPLGLVAMSGARTGPHGLALVSHVRAAPSRSATPSVGKYCTTMAQFGQRIAFASPKVASIRGGGRYSNP